MNPKIVYILSICLLISGLFIFIFYKSPCRLDSQSFKQIYKNDEAAARILYAQQCQEENKRNLRFPLGEVEKAIVCKGLFSFNRSIPREKIIRVIEILNDTSSYIWGEVGTFIEAKKIVFYDKENRPLGITEIDVNGSDTYSYPYLRRMKWGALTIEAGREIQDLIAE